MPLQDGGSPGRLDQSSVFSAQALADHSKSQPKYLN
jgi:hypothetical protein